MLTIIPVFLKNAKTKVVSNVQVTYLPVLLARKDFSLTQEVVQNNPPTKKLSSLPLYLDPLE